MLPSFSSPIMNLEPAYLSLASGVPLTPVLGNRVLDSSLLYQECILKKKYEVLLKTETDPKDRARVQELFPLVLATQGQVNEVLKWSVRVLDRNLVRNVVSYAWNESAPDFANDLAKGNGWVSAFENLEKLTPPLKRTTLDLLKIVNLVDQNDQIKYKDVESAKKYHHYNPDLLKKKDLITRHDLFEVVLCSDCDLQSGNSSLGLLMSLSSTPSSNLGNDFTEKLGPILSSKLDSNASSFSRTKELYESLQALEPLKGSLIHHLEEKMASDLAQWGSREISSMADSLKTPQERKLLIGACNGELETVRKASQDYKNRPME